MKQDKVLVILGPTSTGKTDLGLHLAKKFNGELVSCDSRQVYKGLDIGTGKAPSGIYNLQFTIYKKEKYWEINGIRIWMYDMADPKKQYSVAEYVKDVEKVIDEIIKKNKLPIIVGGTGLYLKALLEGLPNLEIPIDQKLRKQLNNLDLEHLQLKLEKLNKNKWSDMNNSDKQNPRRLIRAIEIAMLPKKNQKIKEINKYDVLKIGLIATRNVLFQRSDERVLRRIKQGMIEEVESLHKKGVTLKRMKELGLEYGVLADYLSGVIKDREELITILQLKIHGYIKRQLTWFKKEKNINWLDIAERDFTNRVEDLVSKWYYSC